MALLDQQGTAATSVFGCSAQIAALNTQYEGATAQEILRAAITELFDGEVALVSSFGADSSVLLHMVAEIDPATPVLFVDTRKLFPETLRYRDNLIEQLGLSNVRSQEPAKSDLEASDPAGMLWMSDTDACCHVRKVLPLERALNGYSAWVSGRKRHQSSTRAELQLFELEDGRVKVNPLANWSAEDVLTYAKDKGLPPHPLVAQGYPSIGCLPCTSKVAPGEDPRAGRWRGQDKTECGIHLPINDGPAESSQI